MSTWGKIGYDLSNYSEADLELCLSSNLHLLEFYGCSGLELLGRQVDIGVGVIDLLARSDAGRLVVIELKRYRIDCNAVGQINRYLRAFQEVLDKLNLAKVDEDLLDKADVWNNVVLGARRFPKGGVTGILVAPEIDEDASHLIETLNESGLSVAFRPVKLLMVPAINQAVYAPLKDEEWERVRVKWETARAKISEYVEGASKDDMAHLTQEALESNEEAS